MEYRVNRRTGDRISALGIGTTAIKAAYNNGILELTLPKKGGVAPASRSIQIEG